MRPPSYSSEVAIEFVAPSALSENVHGDVTLAVFTSAHAASWDKPGVRHPCTAAWPGIGIGTTLASFVTCKLGGALPAPTHSYALIPGSVPPLVNALTISTSPRVSSAPVFPAGHGSV